MLWVCGIILPIFFLFSEKEILWTDSSFFSLSLSAAKEAKEARSKKKKSKEEEEEENKKRTRKK
jgi:hypothetical protein